MPQETYDVIDKYRKRYGIKIEVFMPDTSVVQQMVTKHGNNLFYGDVNLRLLCCQVRKVLPLRRALMNYSAWVTGLRRDQWATRSNIRKIEIDHDHGGIVKLAPLGRLAGRRGVELYPRQRRALQRALRQGLQVDRMRAVHARGRRGSGRSRGQMVVGDGRAQRMRDALRDRDRRLRA